MQNKFGIQGSAGFSRKEFVIRDDVTIERTIKVLVDYGDFQVNEIHEVDSSQGQKKTCKRCYVWRMTDGRTATTCTQIDCP